MAKAYKQEPSKRLEELYNRETKLERELIHVRESIRELINNYDLNKEKPSQSYE